MLFEATSLLFMHMPAKTFSETDAPKWLTGEGTKKGSTMDNRWFWERVCNLKIGDSICTDFVSIKRIK